jgi:hypothetical protein
MGAMASSDARLDPRAVALVVRTMFPHADFPDGPYERTAAAIVESAGEDARSLAQLEQGMAELEAAGFADLGDDARLEHLRSIAGTTFFEAIRAQVISTLYNDPEVWELLGYEGPSLEHGGYLHRGFDDLDWLPDPRIEEAS